MLVWSGGSERRQVGHGGQQRHQVGQGVSRGNMLFRGISMSVKEERTRGRGNRPELDEESAGAQRPPSQVSWRGGFAIGLLESGGIRKI